MNFWRKYRKKKINYWHIETAFEGRLLIENYDDEFCSHAVRYNETHFHFEGITSLIDIDNTSFNGRLLKTIVLLSVVMLNFKIILSHGPEEQSTNCQRMFHLSEGWYILCEPKTQHKCFRKKRRSIAQRCCLKCDVKYDEREIWRERKR